MAELSRLRRWWILHFSRPAHLRALYRLLYQSPPCSLLEAGPVNLARTKLMLALTSGSRPGQLRYVGVDRFEARGGPAVKEVYRTFRGAGADVALLPGELREVLPRWANRLGELDLVILWHCERLAPTDRLWFYMPRILSETGRVLIEQRDGRRFRWAVIPKAEAIRLADAVIRRRAA